VRRAGLDGKSWIMRVDSPLREKRISHGEHKEERGVDLLAGCQEPFAVGGFKDHFSGVAGRYAEFRPDYPRALFEWIARVAAARERVWDCATGNGQAAVLLKEFFAEVIATDASAEQIANARRMEGIRYAVASAEASGLENASADMVTVAQAAHWFDLPRFYGEAKRVLKPGGLVALWCHGTFRLGDATIDELLQHFYSEVVGPFWPPERRFIEEDYRTLHFPLQEIPAPIFHMEGEFTLERLTGYLRTWSATQRFIKARGFDPVEELERKLERHWRSGEGRAMAVRHWPIHIRAGRFAE
jgi:ubiquinone/menaquinone biosynthesis C-methylase UbiE